MNYCFESLRDHFECVRFDVIAGAVQSFTEEMLVSWVKACVEHTGIGDLVCGGGVFMNVKANMLLAELPEVSSIYVMPSAGDESLSIGACLHHYHEVSKNSVPGNKVLRDLYLGEEWGLREEEAALEVELDGFPASVQPMEISPVG